MRILVASAPFAGLTSAQTGAALARAWAEFGAQLAVVPIAESGRGFSRAWADLTDATEQEWGAGLEVFTSSVGLAVHVLSEATSLPDTPSASREVGQRLAKVLNSAERAGLSTRETWLEVDHASWADGGEGFWRALHEGVVPQADWQLHLVTTSAERELHLTGFRGITAARGRVDGIHPGDMLAADQALVDWCTSIASPELGTTLGSGALGGLGAAVLALGGDVVTGPGECARLAGIDETSSLADVVVAGYDLLEFGSKGGDVLPLLAAVAEGAGRPLVAVSRFNWISARESRTMGVEQVFGLCGQPDVAPGEAELTELAVPVARTWCW